MSTGLCMVYRLVYRCRLCGDTFERPRHTPHPASTDTVLRRHLAAFEGVTGIAHRCVRLVRHAGVADLVGVRDSTAPGPLGPSDSPSMGTEGPGPLQDEGPSKPNHTKEQ